MARRAERKSIVAMSMGGVGHVQLLTGVLGALRARDVPVHCLTDAMFRERVERAGARFLDLFARHPLAAVDAVSTPIPARNVTFAGAYAESLADLVATLAPALIVYDTFTVIAPVIARRLGIPYVNVLPNHALVPERELATLREDPRVAISASCWAAVDRLRVVHGMADASPFAYVASTSPHLNLACETEEFLSPDEQAAVQPLAFFGAVDPSAARSAAAPPVFSMPGRRRLYVSFGTVIWAYFEESALAALRAISQALADEEVDVLISLGGHPIPTPLRASIARSNVRVADHVDQWRVLAEADVFLTHHGLSSTHEAIFQRTPMLSYPFFGDQPALARRCQDLGLALALVDQPRGRLDPMALRSALAHVAREPHRFAAHLDEARAWELRAIAGRAAIVDRVLGLAGLR